MEDNKEINNQQTITCSFIIPPYKHINISQPVAEHEAWKRLFKARDRYELWNIFNPFK
jgi:hypothetical protein